nr:zinc finger, CCHC-type [Tanacetum cinerariifolium]
TREYFPPPWTGAHMLRRMRCQHRTPTLDMDLFNLISALNPSKVKTGLRPPASHEVPLLTATASRVIDMEDPDAATESSGTPSTVEKSPLDFDNENPASPMTEGKAPEDQAQEIVAPEILLPENMPATGAAGNDVADANAPPKVLRKDYASVRLEQNTRGGKSLSTMGLIAGATFITPADTKGVNDPDPLSYAEPQPHPEQSMTQEIYQPGWGVTNNCRLDTLDACQDVVDHIVPPGYFSELCHMPNVEFLSQYNKNFAQQIAIGSQLRLRFKQEARVTGEEKLKAAFEEFKKYEDDRVEKRCAKIDALQDALGIDFDEELYLHMLTAITGRRRVIGHDLCLAMMKCGESTELRQVFADVVSAGIAKGMNEGFKYGVEHGKANLDLEAIEAHDPEAETKYVAALHALRDLKYPMVDQLELLKDAPIDVVMVSLHLESDSRKDAPQWIRELCPSSSQLNILVYLEVRDPKDPWAFKEEILLADAIAANISRAEKKKKCRVVCRTHGVGFAHHARSDGVPVLVPTVAPQGLTILLAGAATQTEISVDGASPSDLCDLHATPSLGNKKYFVTFIDDVSRFYVIEPDDSVAINLIIELRDAIFDEHRFSSVPRPSQRSLKDGTEDSGGSMVSERVTEEVVQQPESELRKRKRHRTPKDFGSELQLYLIEGTRDEISDQHFYCFNVEDDLKTFDEAMKSQDVAFWKEAINDEMDFIMGNNTWVLTDLPPVARISTIKLLIAMVSIHNLIIHQMDVKIAFLNGELEDEAPKQWHQKFDEVVLSNGYLLNQADKCVYSKIDGSGKRVIICLYVDDMLIFGTDQVQEDLTKEFLSSRFSMKDIREADVILGIRIKHESNGIAISQSYYIEKVLKKFNYFDCTPVSTPLDTYEQLMPNKSLIVSQLEYSRVIGCLMYAMTCTMPDIAFVVGKLSRYTSNPGTQHWQAIKRVLKYLKKTMDYRLLYSGYPLVLEGYTDASWISNTEDNSSTSDWVFLHGGGAIF